MQNRSWLQVLDALHFPLAVRPYAGKLARTLKAEPGLYLFDILRIPAEDLGRRLENLTETACRRNYPAFGVTVLDDDTLFADLL